MCTTFADGGDIRSTIGQPGKRPRASFVIRVFPSVAVESGDVIKQDQGLVA